MHEKRKAMTVQPFLPPLLPLCAAEDNFGTYGSTPGLAAAQLGRFCGMTEASAGADRFRFMWLLRESLSSNGIEGITATPDEVLGSNAGVLIPVERADDVREVVRYGNTLRLGVELLAGGSTLSLFLVRTLHGNLLQGTRGADKKDPGAWRTVQVHIGKRGTPPDAVTYVPPAPEQLPGLLENWIAFVRRTDIDPIVQAAVMHAQFEMIHPFVDGNGRTGRLLVPLFLTEKGILSRPWLYMSEYLCKHREEYYANLGTVSRTGHWGQWIDFFITAILTQANESISSLREMTALYEESRNLICTCTSSGHTTDILDYVFEYPLFTIPAMANALQTTVQSLSHVINKLERADFFKCVKKGSGRRASVWSFCRMMDMLQGQDPVQKPAIQSVGTRRAPIIPTDR